MKLAMEKDEIVTMYRDAKDKKKQVEILADLNLCSQAEILDILKAGGVSHRALPRTRKKAMSEPKLPPSEKKPLPTVSVKPQPFLKKNNPDPPRPRQSIEMERIRELIRGIRDFASAWKAVDPQWVEEYNELLERRNQRESDPTAAR